MKFKFKIQQYQTDAVESTEKKFAKAVEKAKIKCAERLFNDVSTSKVRYHKVDSYQTLLDIMKDMD